MWDVLVFKPVFNLLVAVYALIPGHNLGVALIIFTIIIRFLMYPMIKKQLHHAKAMRELQPELKKIKQAAKGNRQQEALASMALYKAKQINPFASIGYLIIQLPIFIALYQGITRIANDPQAILDHAYSFIANLPFMQQLGENIELFDSSLVGVVDLTRTAVGDQGIYWAAMLIVLASAVIQYLSSKQLLASQGEKKSLRKLLKQQSQGKQVDQSDMSAAVGSSMLYVIPGLIIVISLGLAVALPLYWLVNGLMAYAQQHKVLKQDATDMQTMVNGQPVAASVTRAPNAKQKRQAARPNSGRRRVQANVQTVKRKRK